MKSGLHFLPLSADLLATAVGEVVAQKSEIGAILIDQLHFLTVIRLPILVLLRMSMRPAGYRKGSGRVALAARGSFQ